MPLPSLNFEHNSIWLSPVKITESLPDRRRLIYTFLKEDSYGIIPNPSRQSG